MASLLKSNFKLTTRRLEIKSLKKSDYKNWKEAYTSTGKKKNKWDFDPSPSDDEQKLIKHYAEKLDRNNQYKKEDHLYSFAVFEKKTGKIIASVMLMDISRNIFQNAYIGYHLLNPYWGQGYGKEIVRGALKIAFDHLNLHRVEAGIDPTNIRSIKLVKGVGFRKEGRSKNRLKVDGKWKDMMIYAITKEDKIMR
jgi:ribosomal-protein-alanine N-acetyltransferase